MRRFDFLYAPIERFFQGRLIWQDSHCLNHRTLYILPTRFGLVYALLVFALFIGALNYQLSPAFFLVFMMAMIGVITMVLAYRAMRGLTVSLLEISPVEVGTPARMTLLFKRASSEPFSLALWLSGQSIAALFLKQDDEMIEISLPIAPRRGSFRLPVIKLQSIYPFGLFRVWGYLSFKSHCVVYPKPQAGSSVPAKADRITDRRGEEQSIGDLKSVDAPWGQMGQIAWKISARGQGWYIKSQAPEGPSDYDLDYHVMQGDNEQRLAILTYWVLYCEQEQKPYSLSLPASHLAKGLGRQHKRTALSMISEAP